MSPVIRRKEKFYGLHKKANSQHPPLDHRRGGGAIRVPTESQRERAQLPVDAPDVRRRRRPRLRAFPGRAEEI